MGLLAFGFAFIWYNYYVEELILPYYKRGNWVLIAIYAILVWLFIKAYGGFKLGYLKKTDIIRRGLELGVDYGLTHSCYNPLPDGRPCLKCDSCYLRQKAFADIGITDPQLIRFGMK